MAQNRDDSIRGRRRKKKSKSSSGIWVALGAIALMLLIAGGGGALMWASGVLKPKSPATRPESQPTTEPTTPQGSSPASATPRDRIVGQWEFNSTEVAGAKMILEVRKSGTLTVTGINNGTMVEDAVWEVKEEKKDRLTIGLLWSNSQRQAEWDIELLSSDEMRVNFLTGRSRPIIYKRKQ